MVPFYASMRHILFGVPVDDLPLDSLKDLLTLWLREDQGKLIVTPNPEFILLANKNSAFRDLLAQADLSAPDGVGLRFAISALTNGTLSHRHTGVDLVYLLCLLAEQQHASVLFLGGDPGIAERAKQVLLTQLPSLSLFTIDPGHLEGDAQQVQISEKLIEQITNIQPDVLVVGLGQGKQERFARMILDQLPQTRIAIGVGGTFDTIAGMKPRAPMSYRKLGLEWLWRLWIEPTRYRRILQAIFVFPAVVLSATLKQHRFIKALKQTFPEIWNQLTNKS